MQPIGTVDITVSESSQKVVWKRKPLNGQAADYFHGTNCTVIAADDFRCDQLSQSSGVPKLAWDLEAWPEMAGGNSYIDNHLVSWILWFTSSANAPSILTVGGFGLLSNYVASILIIVAALFTPLVAYSLYVKVKEWFS